MRVISWNVNGLRAVHKKGFLDWFTGENPDILCIQETKALPEQLSEALLTPNGYTAYWASADRKGYSGVATFCKEKPKNVKAGFGIDSFDTEGRVLITEFESFTLFNIYFPNGTKDAQRLKFKLDFYNATLEVLERLHQRGKPLVISGDYNTAHRPIDLERPEANEDVSGFLPVERQWIDKFIAQGYVDTLRVFHREPGLYTWWDLKSRARERLEAKAVAQKAAPGEASPDFSPGVLTAAKLRANPGKGLSTEIRIRQRFTS